MRVESIWTSCVPSCNRYHVFSTNTNLATSNLYWCRNSRIHESILVCPARHPLLHAAIDKVMETRPSSLRSRQHEYMTSYRQMWKLLQRRSESRLQISQNELGNGGLVCLLQSKKAKHRCKHICKESNHNDGYLAYMKHWTGQSLPLNVLLCRAMPSRL